jgi:hypothetical protein
MTPLRRHLLILKDHLKQSLLRLKQQPRLPPLLVHWPQPQLPLPVLPLQPVLQLVLLVQQELPAVVQPEVPAAVADPHLQHHLTVDVQKEPRVARVKKAKVRASQNR